MFLAVCHVVVTSLVLSLSWMSSVDMAFTVVHYRLVGQLPVESHSCDVKEVVSKIVCVHVCLITVSGCHDQRVGNILFHAHPPPTHNILHVHRFTTLEHDTHMDTTHAHNTHTTHPPTHTYTHNTRAQQTRHRHTRTTSTQQLHTTLTTLTSLKRIDHADTQTTLTHITHHTYMHNTHMHTTVTHKQQHRINLYYY